MIIIIENYLLFSCESVKYVNYVSHLNIFFSREMLSPSNRYIAIGKVEENVWDLVDQCSHQFTHLTTHSRLNGQALANCRCNEPTKTNGGFY